MIKPYKKHLMIIGRKMGPLK